MLKIYETDMQTNETKETKEYKRGNWINMVAPTESEIKQVCEKLKIQEDFIKYSLDFEEKARIDYEEDDNTTLFIIDVPITETDKDKEIEYTTMPLRNDSGKRRLFYYRIFKKKQNYRRN